MPFLDALVGRGQIEKMRRLADQQVRSQFDPNQLNPLLEDAQTFATEGIADESIRERNIGTIFGRTNISEVPGAGSGRSLSFLERLNEQRNQALAEAETKISTAEEEAKREGRGRVATLMSKMKEIEGLRNAKLQENRLLAEAEASRRRRSLASGLLQFGLSAAGGAPGIGAFIGEKAFGIEPKPSPFDRLLERMDQNQSNEDFIEMFSGAQALAGISG